MVAQIVGDRVGSIAPAPYVKTVYANGSKTSVTVTHAVPGAVTGWMPEDLCTYLHTPPPAGGPPLPTTLQFPVSSPEKRQLSMREAQGRPAGATYALMAFGLHSCASVVYVDDLQFGSKAYVHHAPAGIIKAEDIAAALAYLNLTGNARRAHVIFAHCYDRDFDFYAPEIAKLTNAGVLANRIVQIQLNWGFGSFGISPDRTLVCQ